MAALTWCSCREPTSALRDVLSDRVKIGLRGDRRPFFACFSLQGDSVRSNCSRSVGQADTVAFLVPAPGG